MQSVVYSTAPTGLNLCRLFSAKGILVEEQEMNDLTHGWEDKEVHTFLKGISLKENAIVWVEFELAYYDIAIQHVNHYTTCMFVCAYIQLTTTPHVCLCVLIYSV